MMDGDDLDDTTELVGDASNETVSIESLSNRFQSAAEFENWLIEAAVAQWGHLFGQTTYWYGHELYRGEAVLLGAPVFTTNAWVTRTTDVAVFATASAQPVSDTNVQVAGVDEADLIETDGQFLYILSGQDLVIVQAGVGDDLHIMSRTHLDARPAGMYLSANRLTLVSSTGATSPIHPGPIQIFAVAEQRPDIDFQPPTTTVTVLDITNRAAPTVVQNTELDGQLITSRVVDGQLRLVLSNQLQLPAPIAHPIATAQQPRPVESAAPPIGIANGNVMAIDVWWAGGSRTQYMYETRDQYVARVGGEILGANRPKVHVLGIDGSVISERPLFEPTDLTRPESPFERQITTIATFDIMSNVAGPAATANVMSAGAVQVYSTVDNLYLFANQSPVWNPVMRFALDSAFVPTTTVWKFAIDGATHQVTLAAEGEFEGALLNQFAADERDGYLRVVTKPNGWDSSGHSVKVLSQADGQLSVVGSVAGIAPNEELYSVRFVENRAFFVTFRRTDPLFAIDLSNPTNPQKLGELHIPGFSDYLQPIDDNHLLAIGRGADERTGQFQELQVSLFDVSDLSNPRLLHRYSFGGGRSTATPATGDRWQRGDGDHHAVSYFADEQIFALPIYSADGGWGGTADTPLFEPGEGGLQVFKIDVGAGFTPIGLVEHDTLVERSLQIGERLYAISSGTVSVHELEDPTTELGEISIAAPQPPELMGDLDGNGAVDADDLTVFANNFGAVRAMARADGDIDSDGDVDADDLSVFANNFGNVQIAPATLDRPAVIVRRTI